MKSASNIAGKLAYLISPALLLIGWQGLLAMGYGDRRFIPAPTDIFWRFISVLSTGELETHVAATLWRTFAGYVIGAIPAVAVGLLMAMYRPVRIFFDPLIAMLFPIPKVALMPLLLLAFGFGDAFGEIRKQHRRPKPERDLQGKAPLAAVPCSKHRRDRGEYGDDLRRKNHGIAQQLSRVELHKGVANGARHHGAGKTVGQGSGLATAVAKRFGYERHRLCL